MSPSLLDFEAWWVLLTRATARCGEIPADLLVKHVFAITPGGTFTLRRAALEEILRRQGSRKRKGLVVERRPAGPGGVFGRYSVAPKKAPNERHQPTLQALDPLDASCDCPDFLSNSLGLCAHVIAILEDLARRPIRLREAREAGPVRADERSGLRLRWAPIRPLSGLGDWLDQVRLLPGRPAGGPVCSPSAALFEPVGEESEEGAESGWRVRVAADRLGTVEALLAILEARPEPGSGRDLPDPALLALLLRERGLLQRQAEVEEAGPVLEAALAELKLPLYPYQAEGVLRFLERGRLLLADDMGLGKTVQAIAACHALYRAQKVRRGLLIVPASLRPQWLREWALFSDAPAGVLDGPPSLRRAIYAQLREGFLIGSYALLRSDLAHLQRWDPEVVILDEAQRIKNAPTQTARAAKALSAPWRLALTGTPLENRLEELASIMEWIDPRALEPRWRLGPLHTLSAPRGGLIGARGLDTLRRRLLPSVVRRTRTGVLGQLPAREDHLVSVPMTDRQRRRHDSLTPKIAALLQLAERRALTQAERIKLISYMTTQRVLANGLAQADFEAIWSAIAPREPTLELLQELESPKLIALRGVLAQLVLQQGRRVVVFSQWRRMLSLAEWALRPLLEEAGLRSAFFTGGEGQRRRTRNVVEFHDEPDLRVLYTSDAGGVGLNLQRAADCCVNVEPPWNPAVLEQRIARIHRLGQTRPVDVINLVAPGSIEDRIRLASWGKAALFSAIFDGQADSVDFAPTSSVADLTDPLAICDPHRSAA